MKLLFENWRSYLNEDQEKDALHQAMVDAAPGGKWRKLAYKHPTRVAYRDYLASSAASGTHGDPSTIAPEEDDGWACEPGQVEDANGNCIDENAPNAGDSPCDGCVLKPVYPDEDSRIPMSCIEYWWFSPEGKRLKKASRHCGS